MLATYAPAADAFSLDGALPALSGAGSHPVTLQLRGHPLAVADEILLMRTHDETRLHWPDKTFVARFESAELAREFERDHFTDLLDLAIACVHDDTGQGMLWASTNGTRLWLLSGARDGRDWCAFILARRSMNLLREGPAAECLQRFLQCPLRATARPVIELLEDAAIGLGLPRTLPLFNVLKFAEVDARPRLTIKLAAGCEWLLLFPLEFMTAQTSKLQAAWDIEWIATAKSCTRNLHERQQISAELSDLPTLLKHTVIIVNSDYEHFHRDPSHTRLRRATDGVLSILKSLEAVDILEDRAHETHGLRVPVNSDAQTIEDVLHDPDTWYVIANFHVEGNCWIDGKQARFTLNRFAPGSLKHIRLLRIYHCQSMFGANDRTELWQSIVGTLLRAGARRVEGSAFCENYSTFLRQLMRLLVSERGLRPIVEMQCYVAGVDLASLLTDLDQILGDSQRQ